MKNKDPSYAVGYGMPPTEHRWKPGQSGNPAGRRRSGKRQSGDLVETLISSLLAEQRVKVDGRDVAMRRLDLYAEALIRDGLRGTLKEKLLVLAHLDKLGVLDTIADRIAREREEEEERAAAHWLQEAKALLEKTEKEFPELRDSPPAKESLWSPLRHNHWS